MSDTPPSLAPPRHKLASPPWPTDDGPWTVLTKAHRKYSRWVVLATVPTYHEAAALVGTASDADDWITNRPEHQADQPPPDKAE